MSTTSLAYENQQTTWAGRLADYVELTKPRIAILELVTLAVAAVLAGVDGWLLIHALLGTALVAASASTFNQLWERRTDAQMDRTADRPLPAGRLSNLEAVIFGLTTVVVGVAYLALKTNLLTAALGLMTWVLYVLVYTPMKTRTPLNTVVGAVAGALPILMGWTAMGAPLGVKAFTLFLILFLWQFPHFMAIAWLYREQYAAAGMKMLTVVDPTGLRAGAQAVIVALLLVPVSLIPAVLPLSGNVMIYFVGALLLGILQLVCAIQFLLRLDQPAARRLLRASLIYLPTLMLLLVLATPM